MKRSDITDKQVCEAYDEYQRVSSQRIGPKIMWPYDILVRDTGCPWKVAYAAMERADDHNLVDWGVALRSGWLTSAGKELIGDRYYMFECRHCPPEDLGDGMVGLGVRLIATGWGKTACPECGKVMDLLPVQIVTTSWGCLP